MIAVREARPDELAAAGDVVVRAYRALGGGGDAHEAYLEHVRDAAGRARHCPVLVAVDEGTGEVLGSVTYVPGQGNAFAELAGEGEGEFRMLGVAPYAQGRGVGAALVRACIDRARAGGRYTAAGNIGVTLPRPFADMTARRPCRRRATYAAIAATSAHTVMKMRIREPTVHRFARTSCVWAV